jgi:hypothetical protein
LSTCLHTTHDKYFTAYQKYTGDFTTETAHRNQISSISNNDNQWRNLPAAADLGADAPGRNRGPNPSNRTMKNGDNDRGEGMEKAWNKFLSGAQNHKLGYCKVQHLCNNSVQLGTQPTENQQN